MYVRAHRDKHMRTAGREQEIIPDVGKITRRTGSQHHCESVSSSGKSAVISSATNSEG